VPQSAGVVWEQVVGAADDVGGVGPQASRCATEPGSSASADVVAKFGRHRTKKDYHAAVEKVVEAIKAGEAFPIVPSQRSRSTPGGGSRTSERLRHFRIRHSTGVHGANMARMSGFDVHPPTLRKAGRGANNVSGNVSSSSGKLTGATPDAVSAHQGWASAGALQQCLTTWEDRLRVLATEVQQIGADLQQSADHYERADERVVELLGRFAHELNGKGD
jgi:hypothetical protein